jgi:calpain-15
LSVCFINKGNPWGKKEWKGEWSNNWSHWPEHIKSELSLIHPKNDGCFWISFQDLLKYFYDISICKVRADWFESRQSSFFYNYLDGAQVFILNIVQPGEHQFEIELFSTGTKFASFDRNADPDIDLCLILCKVDDPVTGKGLTCLAFEHNVEYFINLSAKLTAGYYFIFATSVKAIALLGQETTCKSTLTQVTNYHSYNLVIHGQSNFLLNQTILPPEIVSDIFYSVGKYSDKIRFELSGNLKTLIIPGSCTHAIIVENLSSTQFIKVSLDLGQSKNLESTRQTTRTNDVLAPGTRQLIAYLTPINYRKGFVIGYKIESLITDNSILSNQPVVPFAFAGLHAVRSASLS